MAVGVIASLKVSNLTTTSFDVTFTKPANVTKIKWEIFPTDGSTAGKHTLTRSVTATTGASVTEHFSGLSPNQKYYLYATPYNGATAGTRKQYTSSNASPVNSITMGKSVASTSTTLTYDPLSGIVYQGALGGKIVNDGSSSVSSSSAPNVPNPGTTDSAPNDLNSSSRKTLDVTELETKHTYAIFVRSKATTTDGQTITSPWSLPLHINTPEYSASGNNFASKNSNGDIQLDGGSLYAGTFPMNAGQINVITDNPDATGVVLNQSGLAGFNAGAKQFYISAVNGDAWFAGTVAATALIAGTPASNLVTMSTAGYLKINTFYQDDAPTASQIGDLWYDTNDGYKMYRWSGTAWQSVQDGAIVTAANAAAAAQSSADGKSRIIYGPAGSTLTKGYAPNSTEYEVTLTGSIDTFSATYTNSTGSKVGDTWFVRNSVGSIIAQYTVTSSTTWTRTKVEGMLIGNLDAGKITVGTLSVGLGITTSTGLIELNASTGKFKATNAEITGAISGGTITGTTIYTSAGSYGITITGGNGAADSIYFNNSVGQAAIQLSNDANGLHVVPVGGYGGINGLTLYGSGSGGIPNNIIARNPIRIFADDPNLVNNTTASIRSAKNIQVAHYAASGTPGTGGPSFNGDIFLQYTP